MITDREVADAIRFDGHSAASLAAAIEAAMMASARLKHVKATQMKRHLHLPLAAQEREAYASEAFLEASLAEAKAAATLEELKAARAHARLCIDIWKAIEQSHRAVSRYP